MKIYIICPYTKTGGPRSLHQLGDFLKKKGFDVYIFYGDHGKKINADSIIYKDTDLKLATQIEDSPHNVIITSETDTGWLLNYKKAKGIVWWLSLDFYFANYHWFWAKRKTKLLGEPSYYALFRYLKNKFWDFCDHKWSKSLETSDQLKKVYHMYNCEYVHNYLKEKNIATNDMQYLCGPIDMSQVTVSNDYKKNMISYGTAKLNYKIEKKFIEEMQHKYPEYTLKPIRNMTHDQVMRTLQISKVYVDLGFFPGPERMPREAVSQYCNIITSNLGSAYNNTDVPIPNKYKFSPIESNIALICKLAIDMCDNWEKYLPEFDKYRQKVHNQIVRFPNDINKLCEYILDNTK